MNIDLLMDAKTVADAATTFLFSGVLRRCRRGRIRQSLMHFVGGVLLQILDTIILLGIGCGDRRRDRFMGFVHLWCELFIYGSDFAGFLLVICGFCFGGGGVMGSEAGAVCLSFVAFLDGGGGGAFSGRETEAFLDGGASGGFSGRETEEEN